MCVAGRPITMSGDVQYNNLCLPKIRLEKISYLTKTDPKLDEKTKPSQRQQVKQETGIWSIYTVY